MRWWVLCLSAWVVAISSGQPLLNPFTWTLDPLQPLDTTFVLNQPARPTWQSGRISIRDGKLVYPDGSRARLYGVTIAGPAAIPDSAQAVAVAQRLRSLGVNLVRLTYFDYTNWDDASILPRAATQSSRGFDSAMMRRFDWFIAQLRQQGIYVSLVLRSVRLARRNDGISGWDSVRNAGLLYSYFLPGYQQVVRDFVRDLLTHRNAFTRIPYSDDPTIAILELDQSNSIFAHWINNGPFPVAQGGQLAYQHSRLLDTLFVQYVLRKYGSEQAVQAAWRFVPRTTANVIGNPSFEDPFDNSWTLRLRGNALAVAERDPLDKRDSSYSMRIRISQPGQDLAAIRYVNQRPELQRYALYRIQLWARTDAPRRLVGFSIANFSVRDTLTTAWKEYTYTFRSNTDGAAEFRVDVGGFSGDVWLDNVRITAVIEPALQPGESFANYTIARSRYNQHTVHSLPRWRDNLEFYQSLAESWYTWMQRLIHDTLRCKALIAPGNPVALLNDVYAARLLDLTTTSTGWDSPYRRIAGARSDSAWYIQNDPMIAHLYGGILYVLCRSTIEGKPMMVNGYAMPYPHASMMEMMTLVPAYLAYQDADVYVLNYYAFNRSSLVTSWVRDRYGPNAAGTITHYEYAGNPVVMSSLPLSTYVFRQQLISPARETLHLHQTAEALAYPPYNQFGAFFLRFGDDARMPLFRRIAIDSFNASMQSYQPQREIPALADPSAINTAQLLSDTEELLWNANDTVLTIRTSRYRAVTGVLRGKILDLSGTGSHTIERLDGGWIGTAEFLSLDTTLDSSQRVFISLITRTCASGAVWTGDSSTYSHWGTAPMQMEGMRAVVNWAHPADSMRLIPLDSAGKPIATRVRGIGKSSSGRFRFTIDQQADRTVWYLAEFITKPASSVASTPNSERVQLEVRDGEIVAVTEGFEPGARWTLRVVSLDGRTVLCHQGSTAAEHDVLRCALPPLSSGVYFVHLHIGAHVVTDKLLIAR